VSGLHAQGLEKHEISKDVPFGGFVKNVHPHPHKIPKILHYKSLVFVLKTHINLKVSATKIGSRIGHCHKILQGYYLPLE